jgi:predicted dehydrogenase
VITEKPMVCTVDHARDLVQRVRETGLKLQVSYQWVFDNRFRRAHQLVAEGALGSILAFSANLSQEWKRSQAGSWRQDPALSGGGQLNDSGSHLVNVILWITEIEPTFVMAFVDNRDTPVDINSSLCVRCSNGAQGTVNILGECSQWWDDWVIWGERGMLVYGEGILKYHVNGQEKERLSHEPETSDPDRNLVDAILGRAPLACPVERGLRVIQLTEAAWESARTGCAAKVK